MISTGRALHPRPVVGRDHARARHLRRQPRLQPAGRRAARRARPKQRMTHAAARGRGPARPLPDAARRGRGGARRLLHARPREARHRRRERLGQVGRPAAPSCGWCRRRGRSRPDRLAFDGIDLLRRQRAADARESAAARIAHGPAGPEILAQPGDAGRRPDRRGARAPRAASARPRRAAARSRCWQPCASATPSASTPPTRTSSRAAWASA